MNEEKMPGLSIWLLALIFCSIAVGAALYGRLPEMVPIHWNIRGEVDGYGGKFFGAFGLPLITLGIYILMVLIPRIDPKRRNYPKFIGSYNIVIVALVLFMLGLYAITMLAALGHAVDVGVFVRVGMGVLFIVMGNYLTRVRHNYFFGIRTPWTLANETVWRKTHRVGGILFVAAGVLTMLSILAGPEIGFAVTIGSCLGAAAVSFVYSYFAFRAEEENNGG